MSDLLLSGTLRVIVLGLIMIAAAMAVLLGYQSMLQIIAGDVSFLAAKIFWSIALGTAAVVMIRFRGELVDD